MSFDAYFPSLLNFCTLNSESIFVPSADFLHAKHVLNFKVQPTYKGCAHAKRRPPHARICTLGVVNSKKFPC